MAAYLQSGNETTQYLWAGQEYLVMPGDRSWGTLGTPPTLQTMVFFLKSPRKAEGSVSEFRASTEAEICHNSLFAAPNVG